MLSHAWRSTGRRFRATKSAASTSAPPASAAVGTSRRSLPTSRRSICWGDQPDKADAADRADGRGGEQAGGKQRTDPRGHGCLAQPGGDLVAKLQHVRPRQRHQQQRQRRRRRHREEPHLLPRGGGQRARQPGQQRLRVVARPRAWPATSSCVEHAAHQHADQDQAGSGRRARPAAPPPTWPTRPRSPRRRRRAGSTQETLPG